MTDRDHKQGKGGLLPEGAAGSPLSEEPRDSGSLPRTLGSDLSQREGAAQVPHRGF